MRTSGGRGRFGAARCRRGRGVGAVARAAAAAAGALLTLAAGATRPPAAPHGSRQRWRGGLEFVRLPHRQTTARASHDGKKMASYKHLWLAVILSLWCAVFPPAWETGGEKELRGAIALDGALKPYAARLKRPVASEGLVSGFFPA